MEKWFTRDCYYGLLFGSNGLEHKNFLPRALQYCRKTCMKSPLKICLQDSNCWTYFPKKKKTLPNILWLIYVLGNIRISFSNLLVELDLKFLYSAIPSNYILKYPHLCKSVISCVVICYCLLGQWLLTGHVFTHLRNTFTDMPRLLLLEAYLAVLPPL